MYLLSSTVVDISIGLGICVVFFGGVYLGYKAGVYLGYKAGKTDKKI